jgi:hypothetical protein
LGSRQQQQGGVWIMNAGTSTAHPYDELPAVLDRGTFTDGGGKAILLLPLLVAIASAQKPQTFAGTISDSMCARGLIIRR